MVTWMDYSMILIVDATVDVMMIVVVTAYHQNAPKSSSEVFPMPNDDDAGVVGDEKNIGDGPLDERIVQCRRESKHPSRAIPLIARPAPPPWQSMIHNESV